jgi:hypothetical protein
MGVVAGGDFLQRGAIDLAGRIERHGVEDDDLLRRLVATRARANWIKSPDFGRGMSALSWT